MVLVSDGNKKTPKYLELKELGGRAEYRKDFKEAVKHYMDSLYHLENDYKNRKLYKVLEEKRQSEITEINSRISKIKGDNPDQFD